MMGRIIKDYFYAFRWSNFKERVANFAYMIVYFATVLPLIGGFYHKAEYALVYFSVLIPLIHILNSACLHIMKMPKIMYMVPLSQEMKREYIVKSTIFRICFCSLLGIICTIALPILGICSIFTYILIIYNIITWALLFCGMNERLNIEERENWPRSVTGDCRGVIQGVDVFFTLISLIGIAAMLCEGVSFMTKEVPWLFAIPAVFIQLPLTIKHMSYWNMAVGKAMNYETSYYK